MSVCDRLDFPHAPVWCPDCYAQESQSIIAREMRRANDLKQKELELRERGYWQEPEARVVRPYTPPARVEPQGPQPRRGGMNIEPVRES
jgi:hypothetical protein